MSVENTSHGSADLTDTFLDICNDEVKRGVITPDQIPIRMAQLSGIAMRGAEGVEPVALDGDRSNQDIPVLPTSTVRVDLMER